jgi:Zn finger protein HypA/HybF involved in hydrogenase expression
MTNKKCKRCSEKVELELELDYPYYCPECDENMYEFEVEEA